MEHDDIPPTLGCSVEKNKKSSEPDNRKICADVESATVISDDGNQPTAAIAVVTDHGTRSTGTIGSVTYYNDRNIGETFLGPNIPLIHRAISLPIAKDLDENSEYVMVNKLTGILQYYNVDEISSDTVGSVLGISVLILKETSIKIVDQCARHGVLHSSHLGQPCFVAPKLHPGLCVALYENFALKFKNKSHRGEGYHALVVPVEAMTLDEFISRFSYRYNWQPCIFAAGGDREAEAVGADDNHAGQISLVGVDTALGKLIKLLNAFGGKFSGSTLRLANAIRVTIMSNPNSKSWDGLIANITIASGINVLLHHLSSTIDPLKHVSSAILIESLQDSLNSKYGFQDEWEVVNVTQRISNALLLPARPHHLL